MNKTELVAAVAEKTGMTRAAAAEAVNALLDTVTNTLAEGEDIAMPGFGTFTVRERAARTGRNPQTGAEMQIEASKAPAFKPGKTLKDAVNGN